MFSLTTSATELIMSLRLSQRGAARKRQSDGQRVRINVAMARRKERSYLPSTPGVAWRAASGNSDTLPAAPATDVETPTVALAMLLTSSCEDATTVNCDGDSL